MTEKRFDVRILTVPAVTPAGEPFGIALARAFGVQLWQAEQITRDAPVLVKRGVTLEVAQRLQLLLTSLGAEAGIVGDLPVQVAMASPVAGAVAAPAPIAAPAPVAAPASDPPPLALPFASTTAPLPPITLPLAPLPPEPSAAPTVVGVPTIPPAARAQPEAPAPTPPPPAAPATSDPDPEKPKVPSLPPLALPAVRSAIPASTGSVPSLNLPTASRPPKPPSAAPPARSAPPEAIPPWLQPGDLQLDPVAGATAAIPPPPRDDLAAGFLAPPVMGTPPASALRARPRRPATSAPFRASAIAPGTIGIVAFVVLGVAGWAGVRWWSRLADAKLLGNTPTSETACRERYCLTGVGVAESKRGRRTLVVAWKSGCIDPNYRIFLEGLAEAHPTDLEVVGVALTVPETRDPRALGMRVDPLPLSWPPSSCTLHMDTLAPDRGYASDWLAPPVTYLSDADGNLTAVWREGMAQEQRDRLTTWLDGKAWEAK